MPLVGKLGQSRGAGFYSEPECQRRRRTEYVRQKIAMDREYAEIVRDSRSKWREAHRGY